MTDETLVIEALEARAVRCEGRRAFFKAALSAAAVGAGGIAVASAVQAAPAALTDNDVLNFLLNLEYLEANFFAFATTNNPIASTLIGGVGGAGLAATGGRTVDLSADVMLGAMALEIAEDELAHVNFLRGLLGTGVAVAQPLIDLGTSATGGFGKLATAAGIDTGGTFDPYATLGNFLLGAFMLEDVVATAYNGALALLTATNYANVAGLLSTETQHAGTIRTQLHVRGVVIGKWVGLDATGTLVPGAQSISNARDALDGSTDLDQGVTSVAADGTTPQANVASVGSDGLVFSRTPAQVLNILYVDGGATAVKGGFFPNGLNGTIKSTAAA